MTMVDSVVDLLGAYEFTPTFPCEDVGAHSRSESFHTAELDAAWRMVAPCCGTRLLICDTRKQYLSGPTCATIRCVACDIRHDSRAYKFFELP